MESLIKVVCATFANDPTSPSIVLSYLQDREVYYGSVVRYHERLAQAKEVIVKTTHETLDGCLARLAGEFGAWIAQNSVPAV